jgi:RNA methyltransferase, TrmH family
VDIVTSRQNPLVQRCRRLAAGRSPDDGALLLDGPHLVREALAAALPIEVVMVEIDEAGDAPSSREVADLARALRVAGVRVVGAPGRVFAAMSPVRTPSGLLALATSPAWTDDALLSPAPALVVVGVDIQDPGNLGAIVRAAEAAWATGVVAAGASADPFGWKALRGAMGSSFRLPVVRAHDAPAVAGRLRERGLRLVAATVGATTPIADVDLTGPVAVLLGSEGQGLPQGVLREVDVRATIPMRPPVESLNVAVTAAVVAFEARRQRVRAPNA